MYALFPHPASRRTKRQRKFAAEIAEAGADLTISTHPHIPQPVEWLTTVDGGELSLHLSDLQIQCDQSFGDMRLYRSDILPEFSLDDASYREPSDIRGN